ncbi:MAG: nucleotidyltransferase domain-containing protein [Alphaproteobacteria bacterium]|nr:nucleotidyltransferase domain-containing protein [Alphaproteobacteria bacterium]
MPLTNEQTRQLIDVTQTFSGYRAAVRERRLHYRYAMRWRKIKGKDYLYCGQKSLGVRNVETEKHFDDYTKRRAELEDRISSIKARLDQMAPVNRALRLGRVPELPARVLRALYDEGAFDQGLMVIGTHALFAYEIAAGEFFEADMLATTDLDLCWDARERLSLLNEQGDKLSVLSVLQRVDRSFEAGANYGLSASNRDNFIVEMIAPEPSLQPVTSVEDDLPANPIAETKSLLSEPPYAVTAIAEDGLPVDILAPQPELFVKHKRTISAETSGRPAIQRRRDLAQADAIEPLVPTLNAAKGQYRDPDIAARFEEGE